MNDVRQCDCERPWPEMRRLGIGGRVRFYACPLCGQIRREQPVGNTPGSVGAVSLHDEDDPDLPEAIRKLARELRRKSYRQDQLL